MANFEQIEQNKFGIKNNTLIFTSPVPEEVGEISIINFGEKFAREMLTLSFMRLHL